MKKTTALLTFLFLTMSFFAASTAMAEWPDHPMTIVVPYRAGGPSDMYARKLQPGLEKALAQKVVVLNTTGHASVGTRRVIDAKPDGYEFLIHETGIITQQASGVMNFGYRDLIPLAVFSDIGLTFTVSKASGWKTIEEARKGAEQRGKPLIAGVTLGGMSHLVIKAIADAAGIDVRFVQIGGSADAYAALIGGQIDIASLTASSARKYTMDETGKELPDARVTTLIYSGSKRHPLVPSVPTAGEALGKEIVISIPHIIFAPKNTPQPIVDKMASSIETAYFSDDMKAFQKNIGALEFFVKGTGAQAYLDKQWDLLAPMAKEASQKKDK